MRNFCPGWVPGGILSTTRRPSSVFTLILEPSSACARFTGTVQTMSSPSRRKNRSGSTCSTTTTSPFPFVPCPRRRSLVPSSVPAGTVITRRFSTRTSPLPPQVWQRSEGTFPLPRHTGHGRFTANPPCPNETTPRPRHSGQVDSVAPGALRTGASTPPRPRVRTIASHLVVPLALVRIAQHVVRLVDLLEALGRLSVVGIAIGMVLLGKAAERLLDLVHRRGLGDPQDLVIVLRRRHQPVSPSGLGGVSPLSRDRSPCHVSTTTRAGRISAPPSW